MYSLFANGNHTKQGFSTLRTANINSTGEDLICFVLLIIGFKAHKAVEGCVTTKMQEMGNEDFTTFDTTLEIFTYNDQELNITELGCPTLQKELDNVSIDINISFLGVCQNNLLQIDTLIEIMHKFN